MAKSNTPIPLGKHLHGAMRYSNLSISHMAKTLGIHRTTLADQLHDNTKLTLDVAHGIAQALGTPLSTLIRQAEEQGRQ